MYLTRGGTLLQNLLGLELPPVAIAFRDSPPPNIARVESPQPAGCGDHRGGDGGIGQNHVHRLRLARLTGLRRCPDDAGIQGDQRDHVAL